ncbi:hypothetical protein CPC08DRAFT_710370 [Agrocybe pediades]|nr:hypothetical protein CPC08DRAFT_710370 [Agrocybe pediades]
MSTIKIRRIQNLTNAEADKITAMLVRAYEDNTAVPAMVGGNDELRDLLFRSMVRAGGLEGDLKVVEDEEGNIFSIALWFRPGVNMWGTEEQRRLGYNEFMAKLDPDTVKWWKEDYAQATTDFIKQWLPVPRVDTWWLNVLGTDPVHQRKGYASMLLADTLKTVKGPTTLAFCTTTEENAEFYEHAGFPIRGRTVISSKHGNILVVGHSRNM